MRLTAIVHHLMPFAALGGGILVLLMPRLLRARHERARVVERNWSTSEAANQGGLTSLTAARHWPVNTLSFEVITHAVQYGSTCRPFVGPCLTTAFSKG